MASKEKAKRYKEGMFFLTNGRVITAAGTGRGKESVGHYTESHTLVSDKVDRSGVRTIVMKAMDRKGIEKRKQELVNAIAKAVKDESEIFKQLLADVFATDWDSRVERLYDAVVLKGKKVSFREGCFKILVGDGRKKKGMEVMLRK